MDKKNEQVMVSPSIGNKLKGYVKEQAIPLAVLLLMIVIASVLSPVFFTQVNLQNLFIQQTMNMVVSLGMFVAILTGGIDLSVGSIVAVASVFCATFLNNSNILFAILGTLAVCLIIGTVSGLIVAKLRIAPFIVTLGMMEFARGIAYWYTSSSPVSWRGAPQAEAFEFIGLGKIANVPMLSILWILMIIITAFMMRNTIIGRIMYAIGGNEEAVKLSGIDVSKWKMFPYVFSALCCGVAGILMTARLGLGAPTNGEGLELDCIAAVVIGGTSFNGGKGNISGVVIGVFILGIINNLLDLMNVSSYPQMMLKGAIIVLAVILSTLKDKND